MGWSRRPPAGPTSAPTTRWMPCATSPPTTSPAGRTVRVSARSRRSGAALARQAAASEVAFRAVVADCAYGDHTCFRAGLSDACLPFVMALKRGHGTWQCKDAFRPGSPREEHTAAGLTGVVRLYAQSQPACWSRAIRAVRGWLTLWATLQRYWQAWPTKPRPPNSEPCSAPSAPADLLISTARSNQPPLTQQPPGARLQARSRRRLPGRPPSPPYPSSRSSLRATTAGLGTTSHLCASGQQATCRFRGKDRG